MREPAYDAEPYRGSYRTDVVVTLRNHGLDDAGDNGSHNTLVDALTDLITRDRAATWEEGFEVGVLVGVMAEPVDQKAFLFDRLDEDTRTDLELHTTSVRRAHAEVDDDG